MQLCLLPVERRIGVVFSSFSSSFVPFRVAVAVVVVPRRRGGGPGAEEVAVLATELLFPPLPLLGRSRGGDFVFLLLALVPPPRQRPEEQRGAWALLGLRDFPGRKVLEFVGGDFDLAGDLEAKGLLAC